jgi:hypothetical protein
MGSWNETCAISNLPIQCGEKVRAFFLTNGSSKFPRTMAVTGEYADYGNVDLDKRNPVNKLFCDIALIQLKKDYLDHTPSYGDDKKPITVWEEMWDISTSENLLVNFCHERRADLSGRQRCFEFAQGYEIKVDPEPAKVYGLMVLESVWQMILNMDFKNPMWISRDKKNMTREELKKDIEIYFKTSFDNVLKYHANDDFDTIHDFLVWTRKEGESFVGWNSAIDHYFSYPFAVGGDYYLFHILGMLVKNQIKFDDPVYKKALSEIVDFYWIMMVLNSLRKELAPTVGRGSQSYEVATAFHFSKGVAKIALEKHKEAWLERQEYEKTVDPLESFYKNFK